MTIQIAIVGFGRIGRNIFRILHAQDEIQVVAIADIAEPKTMEYLLRYDTVHGRFPDPVSAKGDYFYVKGRQIRYLTAREPGEVNWKELGADIVVEATAKYRTKAWLQKHLTAGAKRVVLTAPATDEVDAVIVRGVNDHMLKPSHRLISTSSVTTNCVTPILKILNDAFGVDRAFMTTVHAYTNDQRLADVPHTDLRRSRAAAENIIPTETYAPKTIARILPELAGKLDGMAMNVPVPDGSMVDLVTETSRPVTVEAVNEVVRSAAGSRYKGIVDYVDDPIVSSDVIGDPHSAIFDSLSTSVMGDRMVKTLAWYDNGWGYACRVVEVIRRLASFEGALS
ncbi:MAG: type I glyceraldehyde-3-phosphate dehydrogenase [Pseudomonadota bacterium]